MKASHLHTPRNMESAFGNGVDHYIAPARPSRRRQMLVALAIAVGTVAGVALVLFLMASGGAVR